MNYWGEEKEEKCHIGRKKEKHQRDRREVEKCHDGWW